MLSEDVGMNKTTDPATHPAAPTTAAAIGGYTGAPVVVAAKFSDGPPSDPRDFAEWLSNRAEMIQRLSDLTNRMTMHELEDLCIHAENILECRMKAPA